MKWTYGQEHYFKCQQLNQLNIVWVPHHVKLQNGV